MKELLGVREAAERLGVHENTLRRWERKGLIRAARLPTGVRRFRKEDVERLRDEMWDELLQEPVAETKTRNPSRSRA